MAYGFSVCVVNRAEIHYAVGRSHSPAAADEKARQITGLPIDLVTGDPEFRTLACRQSLMR
jgi:hypothetical protein